MATLQARGSRLRENAGAAVGFIVLSFAFCYPAGLSTGTLDPDNDGIRSYLPFLLRTFWPAAPSVAGDWDPTLFTGLPASHTPFGRYYPPTLLLSTLCGPLRALAVAIVLHHAWAGLGAYLLARVGGLSRAASWLAGVCFAYGGFLVFHRGHPPMHQAAAWLPWVLLTLERYRTRGTVLWAALAGTFLTLLALPGHMQIIVLGGVVWLTYLAYFTWVGPGGACSRPRFVLGVGAALLIGALGSLPSVLPMAEVAHWSAYHKVDPSFVADGHLKVRFLAGLAGPWVLGDAFGATRPRDYLGVSEQGVFYGLVALATAVVGIAAALMTWRSRRRARAHPVGVSADPHLARWADPDGEAEPTNRVVGFWVLLLAENLVLMLSKSLGLHAALALVPVYNYFHIPARHVWTFGLALGLLAGFGLDRLRQADPGLRARLVKWTSWSLGTLAVGCLAVVVTMPSWPDRPGWAYPGFWIPLVSGSAVLVGLAALCRPLPGARTWAALVPVVAFVELWLSIGRHEITTIPPDVLTRPEAFPEVVRWLQGQPTDGPPPRCLMRKETWVANGHAWHVPSAFGSAWGLSALSAYSQAMPDSLKALLHLDSFGHADLSAVLSEERGLSAVGGRYILATGPLPPLAPGFGHRIAQRNDLVWKVKARTPNRYSEFIVSDPETAAHALVAQLPFGMGPTYFVEGALRCAGPRPGRVRIVRTNRRGTDVLAERILAPADFQAGRQHFACTLDLGKTPGMFWLTVECADRSPIELARADLWQLTPAFGERTVHLDPREVACILAQESRQPYPVVAHFAGDLNVYENPSARGLATLVREVRPAAKTMNAARAVLSPGRPVCDLAFVVAPDGRLGDAPLTGPLHFPAGTAAVSSYRPDDIAVRTSTLGSGFLVLAVTKCTGWSASVDGDDVPLCAVDGPLMGVPIPPGEHTVRFEFRPLLAWAGLSAAALTLAGAWIGVLLAALHRGSKARQYRGGRFAGSKANQSRELSRGTRCAGSTIGSSI